MYNFFVEENKRNGDTYVIDGGDFNHIANVLRMKVGDEILVSFGGESNLCIITEFFSDYLIAKIIQERFIDTELPIKLQLFQGLPKADKMELIIQKAVELGVDIIIPVETSRSIVKIEEKKKQSKRERWQAISESSAKQCKRNVIPTVECPLTFKQALSVMKDLDILLIPYENKNGMQDTVDALKCIQKSNTVGVFIGPEGGIDSAEIESLLAVSNAKVISLGKRILRTETAAITALSMVMLHTEMNIE